MKNPVLASAVFLFATLGWATGAPAAEDQLYSIQVRAVPMAEKADGMATYRALRDKGYLVYFYLANLEGKRWFRVAVGAFETTDEAAAFGRAFSEKEGMEHFVARAQVRVTATGNGRAIVVTPNALWTRTAEITRQILVFTDAPQRSAEALRRIDLVPSPDGAAAVFYYGDGLYAVDFESGTARLLAGESVLTDRELFQPIPDPIWSPSGRFVAFVDYTEWEVQNTLWVVAADGSEPRPLVVTDGSGRDEKVYGFNWHSSEDRVLFIMGRAYGMCTGGGDLYAVDLQGNIKSVARRDNNGPELAGPLRFADGHLHYRKCDCVIESSQRWTCTDARIPISDL